MHLVGARFSPSQIVPRGRPMGKSSSTWGAVQAKRMHSPGSHCQRQGRGPQMHRSVLGAKIWQERLVNSVW